MKKVIALLLATLMMCVTAMPMGAETATDENAELLTLPEGIELQEAHSNYRESLKEISFDANGGQLGWLADTTGNNRFATAPFCLSFDIRVDSAPTEAQSVQMLLTQHNSGLLRIGVNDNCEVHLYAGKNTTNSLCQLTVDEWVNITIEVDTLNNQCISVYVGGESAVEEYSGAYNTASGDVTSVRTRIGSNYFNFPYSLKNITLEFPKLFTLPTGIELQDANPAYNKFSDSVSLAAKSSTALGWLADTDSETNGDSIFNTTPFYLSFDMKVDSTPTAAVAPGNASLITLHYSGLLRIKVDDNYKVSLVAAADMSSVADLNVGEWVNITLAVDPVNTRSVNVYVDGELVGSDYNGAYNYTSGARMRIGALNLSFPYSLKNIKLEFTPDAPLSNIASDKIFKAQFTSTNQIDSSLAVGFGDGRYIGCSYSFDTDHAVLTRGSNTNVYLDFSTSSKLKDGTYYDLQGKKYSVKIEFAVDNTNSYIGNIIGSNAFGGKNIYFLTHDANGFGNTNDTSSDHRYYFCDRDGYVYNASTSADEKEFIAVELVADESANTYALYVNGSVAYYSEDENFESDGTGRYKLKDGAVKSKAESLSMETFGSDYCNAERGDSTAASYLRFFETSCQNNFYVKDISVTLIDDEVAYIGYQVNTEAVQSTSETSFDLRFVFGVDDIYVDELKYKVQVDLGNGYLEEKPVDGYADTVYRSFTAYGEKVGVWQYENAQYFSLFTIDGIQKSDIPSDGFKIKITPYTLRSGTGKTFTPTELTLDINGDLIS